MSQSRRESGAAFVEAAIGINLVVTILLFIIISLLFGAEAIKARSALQRTTQLAAMPDTDGLINMSPETLRTEIEQGLSQQSIRVTSVEICSVMPVNCDRSESFIHGEVFLARVVIAPKVFTPNLPTWSITLENYGRFEPI